MKRNFYLLTNWQHTMTIAVSTKVVQTSVKACATMRKGSLGKKPMNCNESSSIHYASTVQQSYSEDLRRRAIWILSFHCNLLGISQTTFRHYCVGF